jgi:hypothetical protein
MILSNGLRPNPIRLNQQHRRRYHTAQYLVTRNTNMRLTLVINWSLVVLAGLLVVGKAEADYVHGTPVNSVIALDDASFPAAIKDPANPFWFLKFYAPWYEPVQQDDRGECNVSSDRNIVIPLSFIFVQ